eukprot:TRINITY_DN4634_c0_g1_i1.p1 TRINITY_DN4634_c0_g1~~TRINITY_DN4634_c0_g1_i1.p1  ORF type:complete len:255 (+),score=41.20 TRINITY_DN4634_c0_g1_i1:277-1041(+)
MAATVSNSQIDLERHTIPTLPGAYYVPNFCDEDLQKLICRQSVEHKGSKRRTITSMSKDKDNGPAVAPFFPANKSKGSQPEFIELIVDRLQQSRLFDEPPFQISVNVYDSPDYWIIPHKDGSGKHVVILSFASHSILDFYHRPLKQGQVIVHTEVVDINAKHLDGGYYDVESPQPKTSKEKEPPTLSLFLEPGSCLLLTGESFTHYAHGIQRRPEDVVTKDIANVHLLSSLELDQLPVTFKRRERVSIAAWANC